MERGYSYVVARDYGFAPNPFGGICSLATCKPKLRKCAKIGDLVFGISPKHLNNDLVFAMKISEKMSFNEYWEDPRFQYKKPIMNGSVQTSFGDNIYRYCKDKNRWFQADSHHSYADGVPNLLNLRRDTGSDAILIADEFFYFGNSPITIPQQNKVKLKIVRNYKVIDTQTSLEIWEWLKEQYEYGIIDFPRLFTKGFDRYDGK